MLYNVDPIVRALGEGWEWLGGVTVGAVLVRLLLSVLCAGVLGIERTAKKQVAGLRTYILVCIGSCISMFINQFIYEMVGTGDMARLASGVVGGLGFLGAGAIIVVNRGRIRGLTTASGLWAAGCIGLAIGIGFYTLALIATLLALIILMLLPTAEVLFSSRSPYFDLHVEVESREFLRDLLTTIRQNNYRIGTISADAAFEGSSFACYSFTVVYTGEERNAGDAHKALIKTLSALSYVVHASANA